MICTKCGNEVPDGAKFCTFCGAAMNEPVTVPDETAEFENPVDTNEAVETFAEEAVPVQEASEQPAFNLNTEGQVKKKKSKAPLLIGIGVVAAALIALIAFNFSTILSWFGVKPDPKAELNRVIKGRINSAFDQWNKYGAGSFSPDEPFSAKASIKLSMNETILSMLAPSIGMDAETLETMLDSISVDYYGTGDGTKLMNVLSLNASGTELFDLTHIMDISTAEQWISIPMLSETALYIYDPYSSAELDNEMEILGTIYSDDMRSIVLKYAEVFVNGLTEVKWDKETVTADGVSQELSVLKCRLTQADSYKIVRDIMEQMKTDKNIEALIQNMAETMDYEFEDLYDSFIESLDDGLDFFEDADTDSEEELFVDVFLSGKEAVGCRIEIPDEDQEILFVTTKDGDNVGFKMSIGPAMEIIGSGKDNGKDGFSGEYVMTALDQEQMTVVLENLVSGDTVSGTIKLKPGAALLEEMAESMDMNGVSVSMLNPAIAIEFDQASALEGSAAVYFEMSGMRIFTLTAEYSEAQPAAIQIPSDYVDCTDDEAMNQWAIDSGLYDILEALGMMPDYSDYDYDYDYID